MRDDHDVLRGLVEGERAALVPSASAQKTTWKKVARSVAIAAPMPAVSSGPIAASKAAASGAKWWAKGIVALAIGGAVVVGVQASGGREADTGVVTSPEPQAVAPAAEAPASPSAAVVPAVPPPRVEIAAPVERVAEPPHPRALPPAARVPKAVVDAPPSTEDEGHESAISELAEEARLVEQARKKLRAGTPHAALSALQEHARRFPRGQLTEERMALTARALCDAGDAERGRARAEALREAFPSSSHLARVDRACE